MLESRTTTSTLEWFNRLPTGRAIKIHSNAMQGKGEIDVIGCLDGQFVAIELKKPGKHPTAIQAHILHQWRLTGAIAITATSLQDVKDQLHDLRKHHALHRTTTR